MKINITIAIPAYNSAKTIGQSIASCQMQEYPLKEILVVDDGSTDDTVAIAESCIGVRVIKNEKNLGIGLNLAKCMDEARGKYVVFLCADDVFVNPMVLSDICAIFNENPRIGVINRYFYQFLNNHAGAVMVIRDNNIMTSCICPSGIALRNIPVEGSNKIFLEMPFIVKQYMPAWEWTTLPYDTVAARLHPGGNTGTFESYYKESPIQVLTDFFGKDFKYHLGLVQLKNRAPKLVLKEVYLTAKINPKNLLDPFFWFCSIVAICVPGSILRPLSDFYRHRINRGRCKIIERPIYFNQRKT